MAAPLSPCTQTAPPQMVHNTGSVSSVIIVDDQDGVDARQQDLQAHANAGRQPQQLVFPVSSPQQNQAITAQPNQPDFGIHGMNFPMMPMPMPMNPMQMFPVMVGNMGNMSTMRGDGAN